jgi:hypothetical protein
MTASFVTIQLHASEAAAARQVDACRLQLGLLGVARRGSRVSTQFNRRELDRGLN